MKTLTVSLVISTYNRPDALEACLESVRRQSVLPIEVIIADDGSTEETRQTIERLAGGFPVPILHVWQEDDGFRLAKNQESRRGLCQRRIHSADRRRHSDGQ